MLLFTLRPDLEAAIADRHNDLQIETTNDGRLILKVLDEKSDLDEHLTVEVEIEMKQEDDGEFDAEIRTAEKAYELAKKKLAIR